MNTQFIKCKYAKYDNAIKSKKYWVIPMNGKENIYKSMKRQATSFLENRTLQSFCCYLSKKDYSMRAK